MENIRTKLKLVPGWIYQSAFIAFVLLVINVLVFYPGHMSNDSIHQLKQATGEMPLSDWHPIAMTLAWSVLIEISQKLGSALIVQLSVFWIALYLMSIYLYRQSSSRLLALLPYIFGILPFVVGISGVIWKDVEMAFSYILACTLLLTINAKTKKYRLIIGILSFLLILYGTLLRYNALPAVIPIIVYLASYILPRASIRNKIIAIAIGALVIAVSGPLLNKILTVQPTHPSSAVMLDDLVHVHDQGQYESRNSRLNDTLLRVRGNCQIEEQMNSYVLCTDARDRDIIMNDYSDLKLIWLKTILYKPMEYLAYRTYTFSLLMFTPIERMYIYAGGIAENNLGLTQKNAYLSKAMGIYVYGLGRNNTPFFFQAWFWLLIAVVSLVLSKSVARKERAYIRALSISSIVYLLSYFPLTVATDYRYIYWPVLAGVFCSLVLILNQYRKKALTDRINDSTPYS